jgi:hypothetical protein
MIMKYLEWISAVEDAFGFSIPDEDAAGLATVGNLHEYILEHRCRAKQEPFLNSMALHKIRRAMTLVLQIPRKDLGPSTQLSTIIPDHRRCVWHALEKISGLRFPLLRRPAWVIPVSALGTIGLAIFMPIMLSLSLLNGAFLVAMITAVVVGYCLSWLTEPLAYEFQADSKTLGQLASATLARNYRAFIDVCKKGPSDQDVWSALQNTMSVQLRIRPDDVTKETIL